MTLLILRKITIKMRDRGKTPESREVEEGDEKVETRKLILFLPY